MADPKAAARSAQQAAANAREAAAAAAGEAAKAPSAQSPRSAETSDQVIVSAAGGATGIAANVPLDVFTSRESSAAERKADGAKSHRDLNEEQERMAEASGAGRLSAMTPGKPGESPEPDLSRFQRPGADRSARPGTTEDGGLAERAAAFRHGPSEESENPLDTFGELPNRGDELLAATGRGGGLDALAEGLLSMPESGQGRPTGNDMIADDGDGVLVAGLGAIADAVVGAGLAAAGTATGGTLGAGLVVAGGGAAVVGVAAVGYGIGAIAADTGVVNAAVDRVVEEYGLFTELNSIEEIEDNIAFNKAKAAHGSYVAPRMPLTPIEGGAAGSGVKDPGMSEDQAVTPPPGWIDGDALLPPQLRTGAAVGGAKGNDGQDWANQRWGASNPSPEASGGGGGIPSAIVRQGTLGLVGQPAPGKEGGSGRGPTEIDWSKQSNGASTPASDQDPEYGMGRQDSVEVNTDPNQGDLSYLHDSEGESNTWDGYRRPVATAWHVTDKDDDADD